MKVYVAKKNLPPFHKINPKKDLVKKFILVEDEGSILTNINNFKYTKTSRPIKAFQAISIRDLSPLQVVRPGQFVDVEVKLEGVAVRYKALAQQGGKLGDTIRLINKKSRKTIYGMIEGPQKVVVTP